MALTLVTAPAVEPITLDDAKRHLRVDESDEDGHILALISAARAYAENFTRRALITQTWDATFDGFPRVFSIERPPLQSVTAASFTYDLNGTMTQVPTAVYTVDTDSEPARVYESYGQSWPTPRIIQNAVRMRFVAGYGDSPEDVPEPIRHAIRLMVSHMHEHREPVVAGVSLASVPMSIEYLLMPYQVPVGF